MSWQQLVWAEVVFTNRQLATSITNIYFDCLV
jgi:hypothetical protein